MLARLFDFASSNSPKSSNRRRTSRGRSLRGVESLERREMMTAVPGYSSYAGAPITIYLDFDGHHEDQWGEVRFEDSPHRWQNVNVPVFSRDADPNFSSTELQMIHQVWQCVAEDFAPFNVNVTTICPSDFSDGKAIRIAVGGLWTDWYGQASGGVSMPDAFRIDEFVNTGFVFGAAYGSARSMADGISHEAGHMFGLEHQSIWNTFNGDLIVDYNPGNSEIAPIMGNSYHSERSLWWKDPFGETGWHGQDDIELLTTGVNALSFRNDDHGSTYQTATRIYNPNGVMHGVISSNLANEGVGEDRDAFIVTVPSTGLFKNWVASVEVDQYSANLDTKIEVYRFNGPVGKNGEYSKPPQLVGIADPGDNLNATLAMGGGGTYMIIVRSHGNYGDLGQYSLHLFEQTNQIPNTNPIPLPNLFDVVNTSPVVNPGNGLGGVTYASPHVNNQLGLAALPIAGQSAKQVAAETQRLTNSNGPSTQQAALDEAFAQFSKPMLTM